jgi:hypothetical protein
MASSSSDSKNISASKLRRRYPGTSRPSNLDIIDDAWAADKLSDDEVETARGEHAISLILEDEAELDYDGIVTSANSSSAAMGALERRRKEEGRWNDLGLDLFDGAGNNNGTAGGGGSGSSAYGGMGGGSGASSSGAATAAGGEGGTGASEAGDQAEGGN